MISEKPSNIQSVADGGSIEHLAAALPYLRRYARAVTGSQRTGDALVRTTLEAALADPAVLDRIAQSRTGLYRTFTMLWRSLDTQGDRALAASPLATSQLGRVSSAARQALLLNQLEDFPLADTATILDVSEEEAATLVSSALDEIARDSAAQVLIIEDEPLIADHLRDIVGDAGHTIVAHATTADEARAAFEEHRPTLVLSDVQLADGSSGIDAIEDILEQGPVPVIFITGFPEKLLTGEGPEPAFLITKPFRDETVRATISQALFFGTKLAD